MPGLQDSSDASGVFVGYVCHLAHPVCTMQVGGPAGSMEGGRQADVAKGILQGKDIPHVVAAPLLIQVGSVWTHKV